MAIRTLIISLETRLTLSLQRFPQDSEGILLSLPRPVGITKRASAVAALFDEGKPAEPPSQARINALGKLREGKNLMRKDWNLIAWGLCDDCGRAGMPIETDSMFEKIMRFVGEEISKGISRKIWFGLLHSYFSYSKEQPELNENWLSLRTKLAATLPILIQNQTRPKAWSRALEKQSELLTENAGVKLGKALFNGDKGIADEVATFLPIPEASWLWRKIVSAQLQMLFEIGDDQFHSTIPTMVSLALQHPRQTDDILIALLTRYESSSYRDAPHNELKQFALDQWQNPQIKSANRWSRVSDEVRKMMLHWFAKADLEHFFSLLQGEGGVDHARLHYWLRFVNQISYTRIVMGADAFLNRSADFIDFRTKNKGRFSQLTGGDTVNNAFIMQIGDYYFVEFSGTGNACYVYSANKLPFNPEIKNFRLNELKNKPYAEDRITHIGDWAWKADRLLAGLGIFAGTNSSKNTRLSPNSFARSASHSNSTKIKANYAIDAAVELTKCFNLTVEDHRKTGGAFWIREVNLNEEIKKRLIELGFSCVINRGYWIK